MKCIQCSSQLVHEKRHGIEVDACPQKHGMWLEAHELDELEDTAFDEDELKGSLVWSKTETDLECPQCGGKLEQFNYRLNNMFIEFCPENHGYWLDEGEDKRIRQLMDERESDMKRKGQAEVDWSKTIGRLRKPSFLDKLTGKGR